MSFHAPASQPHKPASAGGQMTIPFERSFEDKPAEPSTIAPHLDGPWITAATLSPVAMRVTDTRAQMIFVNQPWNQTTGMTLSEAAGLGWLNRVEESVRLTLLERLLAPIAQGRDGFTIDYNLYDVACHGRPVREVTRPRFSPTGAFLGHFSAIVEVGHNVQPSRSSHALEDYDPTLAAASAITHDISPPLTAAIAYNHAALAQLKQDQGGVATTAAAQLLLASNHLKKSSDMLRRLREVLNKGQAYFDTAQLDDLIREATNDLSQDCKEAGVNVLLDLPGEPAPVLADPLQVRKVLSYLLSSAIECVNGIVGPKISVQLDQDPSGLWRVCIRHNGTALRDQTDDTVFSTANPVTRGQTGLGLAISQSIIRGHNGRLWYEGPSPSERTGSWKGGVFTFVLPPCKQS